MLLTKIRSSYGISLATESSDIAAILIEEEKTAHAAIILFFNLNKLNTPYCQINKQTNFFNLLLDRKLLVWNERPILRKKGFDALDNSQKDTESSKNLMRGFIVLLALYIH